MDAYVALVVGLLATPIAGIVTYWVSRPKTNIEIRKAQAEAESISVQTMTHLVDVLNKENDSLREELAEFRKENQQLQVVVADLRREVAELKRTIQSM